MPGANAQSTLLFQPTSLHRLIRVFPVHIKGTGNLTEMNNNQSTWICQFISSTGLGKIRWPDQNFHFQFCVLPITGQKKSRISHFTLFSSCPALAGRQILVAGLLGPRAHLFTV